MAVCPTAMIRSLPLPKLTLRLLTLQYVSNALMAEEQKRKATEEQRYPVYAGVQGIRNNPANSDSALFSDNRTPRGCYIRGNPNHYQREHPANRGNQHGRRGRRPDRGHQHNSSSTLQSHMAQMSMDDKYGKESAFIVLKPNTDDHSDTHHWIIDSGATSHKCRV